MWSTSTSASRLTPRKELAATKAGFASGDVDIVVGTHALLARDIKFRSLGVLVIDEETSVDDAHEMGRRVALAGSNVLGYVLAGPASRVSMSRLTWSPQRHGEGPLSLGSAHPTHRR